MRTCLTADSDTPAARHQPIGAGPRVSTFAQGRQLCLFMVGVDRPRKGNPAASTSLRDPRARLRGSHGELDVRAANDDEEFTMDSSPDERPGHKDKKNPVATALLYVSVAHGASQFVTDILGWFGLT